MLSHSQLYDATKEKILKAFKILIPMLKSLTKKWEINKSPYYIVILKQKKLINHLVVNYKKQLFNHLTMKKRKH